MSVEVRSSGRVSGKESALAWVDEAIQWEEWDEGKQTEIRVSSNRLRCLATRDCAVGTSVLCDVPIAIAPNKKSFSSLCQYCMEEADEVDAMVSCPTCHTALYCSSECLQYDKAAHDYECVYNVYLRKESEQSLPSKKGGPPRPSTRIVLSLKLLAVLVSMRRLGQTKSSDGGLLSGMTEYRVPSSLWRAEESSRWQSVAIRLAKILGPYVRSSCDNISFGSLEILEILISVNRRGREVYNMHQEKIGLGIYSSLWRVRHSCFANAVMTFVGRQVTVKITDTCGVRPDGEVTISYFRPEGVRKFRCHKLLVNFGVSSCDCRRCMPKDDADIAKEEELELALASFRCPLVDCNGFLISDDPNTQDALQCHHCGAEASRAVLEAKADEARRHSVTGRDITLSGENGKAKDALESALRKQVPLLSPLHQDLQLTLTRQFALLCGMRLFRDCPSICRSRLAYALAVYPPVSPVVGLVRMELALALCNNENLTEAEVQMTGAVTTLEWCFGKTHSTSVSAFHLLKKIKLQREAKEAEAVEEDGAKASPVKVAIVTTLRGVDSNQLLSFLAYHIKIGVFRIYLFFDAADEDSILISHVHSHFSVDNVRVLLCDKQHWQRAEGCLQWPRYSPHIKTEVMARQALNAELALGLCKSEGIDWLLHIDIDEIFLPPHVDSEASLPVMTVGECFTSIPGSVDCVSFMNMEAALEQTNIKNCFMDVTLFKNNPMDIPAGKKLFYPLSERHGIYFTAYGNGKSAVRVAPFVYPDGVHGFQSAVATLKVIDSHFPKACLLHYPHCGEREWRRKYKLLGNFSDKWFEDIDIPVLFHRLSRDILAHDSESVSASEFYNSVMLFDDKTVVNSLVENRVCYRIEDVKRIIMSAALEKNFDPQHVADEVVKITTKQSVEIAVCSYCRKGDVSLFRCSACRNTLYCDRSCQKADYKHHKKVCHDNKLLVIPENNEKVVPAIAIDSGVKQLVNHPTVEDGMTRALDQVAETLSSGKLWCAVDGVFGQSRALMIRQEVEHLKALNFFKPGEIDGEVGGVRGDSILYIDNTTALELKCPNLALLVEALYEIPLGLNQRMTGLNLPPNRRPCMIAWYPGNGTHYDLHLDEPSPEEQGGTGRKITVLYYLNPSWRKRDGGELRAYHADGSFEDVAPVLDRLFVFWSERVMHEVLPSFFDRIAVSLWIHGGPSTTPTVRPEEKSDDNLMEFLQRHDLSSMYERLVAQDITLALLPSLTEVDMAELGLTIGQRKKIVAALKTQN